MEPIDKNTQEQITKTLNKSKKKVQPIDPTIEIKKHINKYKDIDYKSKKGKNVDVFV